MKKKIIVIVALVLLVIGGGIGTGIYISDNHKSEAAKAHTEMLVNDNQDAQDLEETDQEKEPTDKKEDNGKKEDGKQTDEQSSTTETSVTLSESTQETNQTAVSDSDEGTNNENGTPAAQPASESGGTPNPPAQQQQPVTGSNDNIQPTTTEREKVWHEPVYKDVWVVDVPAHTEEIPEYETKIKEVCNGCGADITSDPWGHTGTPDAILRGCGGFHDEFYNVQIGTTTLEYPEEGHWEKVLVQEGYWE